MQVQQSLESPETQKMELGKIYVGAPVLNKSEKVLWRNK
jgi:hypothetical protein